MPRFLTLLCCLFSLASGAAARPTLAILYFDYDQKDGELEALKKGLAQMLITDLVNHPAVTLVERARMQEIFDELKLNETKKVDPETAVKVGKILGAQYVLIGGYMVVLGKMQLTTRLVNVETTATVGSARAVGPPDSFFDLEAELVTKLTKELTAKIPPTPAAAQKANRDVPARPAKSNLKVALGYSRGLAAIDKKDKATAKKELEAVLKEQPDFVLATLDLAGMVK